MESDRVKQQPSLVVHGNNIFHSGWLYGIFHQEIPAELSGSDIDSLGFIDGYMMARETVSTDPLLSAISGMAETGQVIVKVVK